MKTLHKTITTLVAVAVLPLLVAVGLSAVKADIKPTTKTMPLGQGAPSCVKHTYTSSDGPFPIRDSLSYPVEGPPAISSIVVPDSGFVQAMTLTLHINHSYWTDMVVRLYPPDGCGVLLGYPQGDEDSGEHYYVYSEAAPFTEDDQTCGYATPGVDPGEGYAYCYNYIWEGEPYESPYTRYCRSCYDVPKMYGKQMRGTWRLKVTDYWPAGSGTLYDWTLELCSSASYSPGTAVPIPTWTPIVPSPTPTRTPTVVPVSTSTPYADDVRVCGYKQGGLFLQKWWGNQCPAAKETPGCVDVVTGQAGQANIYSIVDTYSVGWVNFEVCAWGNHEINGYYSGQAWARNVSVACDVFGVACPLIWTDGACSFMQTRRYVEGSASGSYTIPKPSCASPSNWTTRRMWTNGTSAMESGLCAEAASYEQANVTGPSQGAAQLDPCWPPTSTATPTTDPALITPIPTMTRPYVVTCEAGPWWTP